MCREQAYAELLATLASDERQRASEFCVDDPKRRYVTACGTSLQKAPLANTFTSEPSDIELTIRSPIRSRIWREHVSR